MTGLKFDPPSAEDYTALNDFRASVMATQMVSFLRSQIECEDFEKFFENAGLDPSELSSDPMFSIDLDAELHGLWGDEVISQF